ncbi:MAG: RluA family pseudouridine synthase, partial [Clostridia bacterium]|nr:RluA family pseudouridine synthase [Clostridia bacterium]
YTYLKNNGFSENYVKNLRKKEGYIILNNEVVFMNHKINNGDVLKIFKNPNTRSCISVCSITLDIVYEDDDLLVINKPSGLATMPSRSHYANNLSGAILNYMITKQDNFVVRIVNRLDKDTAGLVIVAKNSLVCNYLNNSNDIHKKYYAVCEGVLENNTITINKHIATQKNVYGFNSNKRVISAENGKPAITYVKLEKQYKNYFLASMTLEYGRTHQIRVHMSSISHPLLGDELYGNKSELINHTALVCKEIELVHPTTKQKMHFEVPFPNDFKFVMELD